MLIPLSSFKLRNKPNPAQPNNKWNILVHLNIADIYIKKNIYIYNNTKEEEREQKEIGRTECFIILEETKVNIWMGHCKFRLNGPRLLLS